MKILLVESRSGVGEQVASELASAGHHLVRCHLPGDAPFPCRDLEVPGSCPLSGAAPADLVVSVRSADEPVPTASEVGIGCALRLGIPVVCQQDGAPAGPYDGWAVPVGRQGLEAACDIALQSADAYECQPLVDEVVRLHEIVGADTEGIDVSIAHGPGETRVSVTVPEGSPVDPATIASRVHARLGAEPGRARPVIDIGVRVAGATAP